MYVGVYIYIYESPCIEAASRKYDKTKNLKDNAYNFSGLHRKEITNLILL